MDLDDSTQPPDSDQQDATWGHPGTLGLLAFALAVLTLFDVRVLQGSSYTVAFAGEDGAGQIIGSGRDYLVAGSVLTALFCLLPLVMARVGLRRLIPDDGLWVGHVLRTAMALSVVSLVLHTLRVLVVLANDQHPLSILS